MAEDTAKKLPAHLDPEKQFKPGQSGNPGGRPRGARSRLGEAFLEDLMANWELHGIETIETVRTERPQDYLKVVASILPKELNVKVNELDDLTDDQLARQYAAIAESLVAAGLSLGAGNAAPGGTEQAGQLPTIQ